MFIGLESFLRGRKIIVILLAIAFIERVGWAWKRGMGSGAGEANNVALALSSGRGFADPYFVDSGPTAHLMPTTPLLAGGVHALLGTGSPAAEIVLQMLACLEMIAGYLLLFLLAGRLGVPWLSRLGALVLLCVCPLFMGQESLDFRYWEGGLAVVCAVLTLNMILTLDAATTAPSSQQQISFAALLAMSFFISPAFGAGLVLCAIVLALRRWSWAIRFRTGAIAGVILAILLVPWTIRNDRMLGKPIVLRSNAALEMAIANNDASLGADHKAAFNRSITAFHPAVGEAAAARLRQVGEIAYMAETSKQVSKWIAKNQAGFIRLAGRHVRQMVIAEPFQFEIGIGAFSGIRSVVYSVLAVLGIAGIALGVRSARHGYEYVGIVVATVILTYAPFQPMARYLYLIYGILTVAAFDAVGRSAVRVGIFRL
ncbi:hypothetical protein [Sphingomonas sp. Leaf339]|uniref:hypothetical protein n=1 Tax=Sphingomonas sp. Leaf339 TaxID=1736343 RepID=UPI000AEEEEC5|nr:hypothetical protein [Sphingomonas sp. Leaf339]